MQPYSQRSGKHYKQNNENTPDWVKLFALPYRLAARTLGNYRLALNRGLNRG